MWAAYEGRWGRHAEGRTAVCDCALFVQASSRPPNEWSALVISGIIAFIASISCQLVLSMRRDTCLRPNP